MKPGVTKTSHAASARMAISAEAPRPLLPELARRASQRSLTMDAVHTLPRVREYAQKLSERAAFLAPLLLRITVGVVFVASGWGKLHNLEKVTEFFSELGIPAPGIQAVFVSWVELVCGAGVLLGLLSRLAAVPLMVTMLVAIITAKAEELSGVVDLLGTVEFAYIAMLLVILIAGPGKASLDALIFSARFAEQDARQTRTLETRKAT